MSRLVSEQLERTRKDVTTLEIKALLSQHLPGVTSENDEIPQ